MVCFSTVQHSYNTWHSVKQSVNNFIQLYFSQVKTDNVHCFDMQINFLIECICCKAPERSLALSEFEISADVLVHLARLNPEVFVDMYIKH